jgi:aquaporin Z
VNDLRGHWREYLCEGLGLGGFMIAACLVTALFEYPGWPVHGAIPSATVRRVLIGIAMGLTAIAIIYSPLGKRSGAHINPSVTLTFYRLGRVAPWDAVCYVLAQLTGGTLGVVVSRALFPAALMHPAVHFVVTAPGASGIVGALVGEATISFILMGTVLAMSASRHAAFTGVVAGCLVAAYVAVEAPYSGMSMNPARSVASSLVAGDWPAWWLYVFVPPLSMLLAAEVYLRAVGWAHVACAKLRHAEDVRCIFCGFVP